MPKRLLQHLQKLSLCNVSLGLKTQIIFQVVIESHIWLLANILYVFIFKLYGRNSLLHLFPFLQIRLRWCLITKQYFLKEFSNLPATLDVEKRKKKCILLRERKGQNPCCQNNSYFLYSQETGNLHHLGICSECASPRLGTQDNLTFVGWQGKKKIYLYFVRQKMIFNFLCFLKNQNTSNSELQNNWSTQNT